MVDSNTNDKSEESAEKPVADSTPAEKKPVTPRKRAPRKTTAKPAPPKENPGTEPTEEEAVTKKPATPRKRAPRKTTTTNSDTINQAEKNSEINPLTEPSEEEQKEAPKKPVTPRKRAPRKTATLNSSTDSTKTKNSEINPVLDTNEEEQKEAPKKPVTPRKRAPRKTASTTAVDKNLEINPLTEPIEEEQKAVIKKPVTPRKRAPRKTSTPVVPDSKIKGETSQEKSDNSKKAETPSLKMGSSEIEPTEETIVDSDSKPNADIQKPTEITRWEDEGGSPLPSAPATELEETSTDDSPETPVVPPNEEKQDTPKKPTEEDKAVPIKIVNDSRIFSHVGRADFAAYHHQNAAIKKFMIAVIAILSFALILLVIIVSFSLSKISHNLQATNAIVSQSIVNSGLENLLSAELGEPVANHWYNNENPQIMYAQNHRGDVFRFLLEGNIESDNVKIVGVEQLSSQVGKFESTVGLLQPNRSPEISHIITELNKDLEIGVKNVWVLGSPDEQKVAVVDEKNRGYIVDLTKNVNNPDSKIVSVTQVR